MCRLRRLLLDLPPPRNFDPLLRGAVERALRRPLLPREARGVCLRLQSRQIYLNFALNITKGCDCEPHAMTPVLPDIGLFLSSDPVAVDAACWDAAARLGKSFRGRDILAYAEKCGAGSTRYELIQC